VSDADEDEAQTLRPLHAVITYRPRTGNKVLTLRGSQPREAATGQPMCADIDGISLHATARFEARDRKRLEQFAATSLGQRCRTSGFNSTPPGRWNSSSTRRGATARHTWQCRRWSSCGGWRRWIRASAGCSGMFALVSRERLLLPRRFGAASVADGSLAGLG
jgi:hypothetical protein